MINKQYIFPGASTYTECIYTAGAHLQAAQEGSRACSKTTACVLSEDDRRHELSTLPRRPTGWEGTRSRMILKTSAFQIYAKSSSSLLRSCSYRRNTKAQKGSCKRRCARGNLKLRMSLQS